MRILSLNQTLDSACSVPDKSLMAIKGSMISLCADIDRYFRVIFEIDLNKPIDENHFKKTWSIFPSFQKLSLEQFNRYILLFTNIRNVSAHFYCSKPIFIDDDLTDFIKDGAENYYAIRNERKITVYGAALVLIKMSQKYMIWPFCTTFLRGNFFKETGSGDEMSAFQINQQKIFNNLCGLGKPIAHNANLLKNTEETYINNVFKRYLTLIFFDLEKSLLCKHSCESNFTRLSSAIKRSGIFSEELASNLTKIRNCWFHGFFIQDKCENYGDCFEFTMEFAFQTFKELSDVLKQKSPKFDSVINDISYFGQACFEYYAQKMIETSFKILDSRLLTENKLEERLDGMMASFKRFDEVDPKIYEEISSLLNVDRIKWHITAKKFSDKCPRQYICKKLRILKIHSNKEIEIGAFKTDKRDIILVGIEPDNEYTNFVNNVNLRDAIGKTEKEYSKFISLVDIEL